MSRNSLLRDIASWKDLVQRVEAEGSGESKLSLAVALGGLLASSDFLDQVAQLETRFAGREEEATVVLTTVHQAKGLNGIVSLSKTTFALCMVPKSRRGSKWLAIGSKMN